MNTSYTHEAEATGETWEVEVNFSCSRGCLPSLEYPGDPPELEWELTVKSYTFEDGNGEPCEVVAPGTALFNLLDQRFADLVDADDKLRERIEEACWSEADGGGDYYDEPERDYTDNYRN